MTLKDLRIGESAKITAVGGEGALRQHFLDMGVVPGAEIKLMKLAPMGDPMEFRVHGYELTLRLADAEKIEADPIACETVCPKAERNRKIRIDAAAKRKRARRRNLTTRGLARAVFTMSRRMATHCRRGRRSPLRWQAIRIAVRRPCSTSSPVPTNMSETFRA